MWLYCCIFSDQLILYEIVVENATKIKTNHHHDCEGQERQRCLQTPSRTHDFSSDAYI